MTIKAPTPEEIHEIARDHGLPLGPDEAARYAELVAPFGSAPGTYAPASKVRRRVPWPAGRWR
jgi:hypothetical protein